MRKAFGVVLLVLCSAPFLLADTEDTVVFKARMLPDNEVPAVPVTGASADAVITVRAVRDIRGAVTAATVIFEISYTVPDVTTFTGLHIHNGPVGVNAGVVIPTALSAATSPTEKIGRYVEAVDVASNRLVNVSGLMSNPELYYVNIHSTVYPGGMMRAQLQRSKLTLRPALSPANEVPAVTGLDAQGAGAITIAVERDATGNVTSGNVTFDVDYRFPGSVTINGLHIHKAAAGVNGDIVIDSGISSTNSITNSTGRGNIFRVADVPATNTAGLSTLAALLFDPSGYYVNLHTTANPGGVIRGQLELDTLNFMGRMVDREEIPPTGSAGFADYLVTAKVTRDAVGNVNGGSVEFNLSYGNFPAPTTFTGLHIHNGLIGVNAGVVLGTDLSGTIPVVSDSGAGTINRKPTFTTAAGIAGLAGLFVYPEAYYINIHSTTFPGGIVRSQLARESYHSRPLLSPSNVIPAVTSTASGTPWMTVTVARNAAGAIASGRATFDVNYTLAAAESITGLHLHRGSAVVNGSIVVDSGITDSAPVLLGATSGNITRTVDLTSTSDLQTLADLIKNPNGFYVDVHTTSKPDGLMRSQMLPFLSYLGQVAGGGDWITSVTIKNPSATASAQGQINFFEPDGDPMPATITDPNLSFWIPPSGSVTFNTHNKGTATAGSARVYSNNVVNVEAGYFYPGLKTGGRAKSVVANAISVPVSISIGGTRNTAISLLSLESTIATILLTLRDSGGTLVPGGTAFFLLGPGEQIDGFLTELFPTLASSSMTGDLTIEMAHGPIPSGLMVALALQFDATTLDPVTIKVIN